MANISDLPAPNLHHNCRTLSLLCKSHRRRQRNRVVCGRCCSAPSKPQTPCWFNGITLLGTRHLQRSRKQVGGGSAQRQGTARSRVATSTNRKWRICQCKRACLWDPSQPPAWWHSCWMSLPLRRHWHKDCRNFWKHFSIISNLTRITLWHRGRFLFRGLCEMDSLEVRQESWVWGLMRSGS